MTTDPFEPEEETTPPLVHQITEATQPNSLMEQLAAKRKEIAETRSEFFPIVGYESEGLCAEHRLMDRPEVEIIGKNVLREFKERGDRQQAILVDQIINSVTGIYVKNGKGKPEPLLDDDGSHVRSWDHFAERLGWTRVPDSRAALYYVFGDNEFMIGQYGILLNRWMGNTGIKVDEELLGEGV